MNESYGAELGEQLDSEVYGITAGEKGSCSFYEVLNYTEPEQALNFVSAYVDSSLYQEDAVLSLFAVRNGILVRISEARGYGYYGLDPYQWTKTSDTSVSAQQLNLGDPLEGKYVEVEFAQDEEGNWKVSKAAVQDCADSGNRQRPVWICTVSSNGKDQSGEQRHAVLRFTECDPEEGRTAVRE